MNAGESLLKNIVIPDKRKEVESDQESLQWYCFFKDKL